MDPRYETLPDNRSFSANHLDSLYSFIGNYLAIIFAISIPLQMY